MLNEHRPSRLKAPFSHKQHVQRASKPARRLFVRLARFHLFAGLLSILIVVFSLWCLMIFQKQPLAHAMAISAKITVTITIPVTITPSSTTVTTTPTSTTTPSPTTTVTVTPTTTATVTPTATKTVTATPTPKPTQPGTTPTRTAPPPGTTPSTNQSTPTISTSPGVVATATNGTTNQPGQTPVAGFTPTVTNGSGTPSSQQGSGFSPAMLMIGLSGVICVGSLVFLGVVLIRRKIMPAGLAELPPSGAQPWKRAQTSDLESPQYGFSNGNTVASPFAPSYADGSQMVGNGFVQPEPYNPDGFADPYENMRLMAAAGMLSQAEPGTFTPPGEYQAGMASPTTPMYDVHTPPSSWSAIPSTPQPGYQPFAAPQPVEQQAAAGFSANMADLNDPYVQQMIRHYSDKNKVVQPLLIEEADLPPPAQP